MRCLVRKRRVRNAEWCRLVRSRDPNMRAPFGVLPRCGLGGWASLTSGVEHSQFSHRLLCLLAVSELESYLPREAYCRLGAP